MFLVFVESVFVVVVAVAAVVEVGVAIVMVNPKPSTAAVAENRVAIARRYEITGPIVSMQQKFEDLVQSHGLGFRVCRHLCSGWTPNRQSRCLAFTAHRPRP